MAGEGVSFQPKSTLRHRGGMGWDAGAGWVSDGREELDQRGRSRARGVTSSWGSCLAAPGGVKDG